MRKTHLSQNCQIFVKYQSTFFYSTNSILTRTNYNSNFSVLSVMSGPIWLMQIGLKHFWERGKVYKMMKKLRLRGNEEAGEAGSEGGGIRVRFEDRGFGEDIGHWTLDSECSRRWRLRRPTRGQSWKMSKVWNRKKYQISYWEQKDGTKFYPRNSLVPILHNGFKEERNLQKSSNINRKSLIWKKVLVTWETHSWTHLNVNWELQKVLKCDLDLTCVSPIPQISIKWEQRLHLFITADASSQILYLATLVNQPGPLTKIEDSKMTKSKSIWI